jgi:hypothetical protein
MLGPIEKIAGDIIGRGEPFKNKEPSILAKSSAS